MVEGNAAQPVAAVRDPFAGVFPTTGVVLMTAIADDYGDEDFEDFCEAIPDEVCTAQRASSEIMQLFCMYIFHLRYCGSHVGPTPWHGIYATVYLGHWLWAHGSSAHVDFLPSNVKDLRILQCGKPGFCEPHEVLQDIAHAGIW
jgi:hypothetical protein